MELNYRNVLKYIKTHEDILIGISRVTAIKKLSKVFKVETEEQHQEIINAYNDWRDIYTGKKTIIKNKKDSIISFRCTSQQKEEIKNKLKGRRVEDILMEALEIE